MQFIKAIVAVFVAVSLAGCGGGATSPTTSPAQPQTTYRSLNNSTATETSTLAGVAIRTNTVTGDAAMTQVNGTLNHAERALLLDDGTYLFLSNAVGFQPNGTTRDSNGATFTSQDPNIGGGFQYLTVYNNTYSSGGVSYDSLGVAGIVTTQADMPQSGFATFGGEGEFILVTTASGTTFLSNGEVISTINFGATAGQINTSISNFDATDSNGNTVAQPEIAQINIFGSDISGTSFSGGTVQYINAQGAVTSLGAGSTTTVNGTFFGIDQTTNGPDEIGGVLIGTSSGSGANISGVFVAD